MVGDSRRRWSSAVGRPMMMPTSPGGAAALVAPATAGRGGVGGLRRSIDKFRGTDTATMRRLLTSTFPAGKSAGLYPFAGGGRRNLARRSSTGAGARISFVLVELLIGAAGRRWSSGGRAVEVRGRGRRCRRAIERPGGLCVVRSLRLFRLEICWSLSLCGWWPPNLARRLRWRAAARPARAADFVLVELLIGAAGRRWSSGGRAVEVRGRAALPAGDRAARGALRRLLTPTFRLENLLVFIPLRVVAAEICGAFVGAVLLDRRGRRIRSF